MTIVSDFNPVIFKNHRHARPVPGDAMGRWLEVAILVVVGVGKRKIKRVLQRGKTTRAVAATVARVVGAAEVLLPLFVPKAFTILYEII